MSVYKIAGLTLHDADVHIIQNDTYLGSKAVSSGNYEVSFESTTPSGLIAVAKKGDGEIYGYGDVVGVTASGIADLTAGGGATIKSIQTGSVTIGSGSSSSTATISNVDTDKTMLLWNGTRTVSSPSLNRYAYCYTKLTNGTTVTAVRQGTSGSMEVCFTVVEFEGGINSVQRGVIANSQYSQLTDVTITEVNTSKAFVNFCGWNQSNDNVRENMPKMILPNSTTVRMYLANVNNFTQGSYEVIEFS